MQVAHLSAQRQELLRREYLTPVAGPAQPPHGFKGQLHACWTHKLRDADAGAIVQGKMPMCDVYAGPPYMCHHAAFQSAS